MKKFFIFAVAFATLSLVSCGGGEGSTQQDSVQAGNPQESTPEMNVEDNANATEDTTATGQEAPTQENIEETNVPDPNAAKDAAQQAVQEGQDAAQQAVKQGQDAAQKAIQQGQDAAQKAVQQGQQAAQQAAKQVQQAAQQAIQNAAQP